MTVKGISIQNIYYMLAYAFRALQEGAYARVNAEEFENAEDLFGEILSIGMSRLLKRGLHRMYEERIEDLRGLRGKVDLQGTMRHLSNNRQMIVCVHDEFSVDNQFNQILKSTADALIRTGRLKKSLVGLKRSLVYFGDVKVAPLRLIRWTALSYERNNYHYQMLMNICRFVVDGLLMGEHTEGGEKKIRSMEYDENKMSALYEEFLRQYFLTHYRLHASSKKIDWCVPEGTDVSLLPSMRTDITLTDEARVLILDAKFYGSIMQENYEKLSFRNQHLNQILVYAMNEHAATGLPVAAMLLYAKTSECAPRPGRWQICGNAIGVDIIDLSQPFQLLAAQLDAIVEEYFGVKKEFDAWAEKSTVANVKR